MSGEVAVVTDFGIAKAIELAREAVAIDSTFTSAWNLLGTAISNYGGQSSAIDTTLPQAFRYCERLPERERNLDFARNYDLGPNCGVMPRGRRHTGRWVALTY